MADQRPTENSEQTDSSPEENHDVTAILSRAASGDDLAINELLPLVYGQLRSLAQHCLRAERPDHTLTATALVHEAYLRLIGPRKLPWQNQAHFYTAAAESIRRILVDHARAHRRQKRPTMAKREALSVASVADLASAEKSEEILALEDAICRLESENPEAGRIVRLRFYAGLSIDETAAAMELPARTVDRRWSFARAWLHKELSE